MQLLLSQFYFWRKQSETALLDYFQNPGACNSCTEEITVQNYKTHSETPHCELEATFKEIMAKNFLN